MQYVKLRENFKSILLHPGPRGKLVQMIIYWHIRMKIYVTAVPPADATIHY